VEDTRGFQHRLDAVFVHELDGKRRIFLVITNVWQAAESLDNVLQLPCTQIGTQQTIIGLPACAPRSFIWSLSIQSFEIRVVASISSGSFESGLIKSLKSVKMQAL
jgi:hypothetical protein